MGQQFQTTQWTLVLDAAEGDSTRANEALAALCQAYWYPLYAYVRRRGHSAEEAEDLTQGYFCLLLEKHFLEQVEPSAGRFRSFLLSSLRHFLSNEYDKARTLKRGGRITHLSIDTNAAERRFKLEPADTLTPESAFEKRWAVEVTQRALERLEEEMEAKGKVQQFETLRPYLVGQSPSPNYKEVAEKLEISEGAVRIAILRLRRRYGNDLRSVIAETVDGTEQVDHELRHLLKLLSH